jgi:hypothetical protein
MNRDLIRQLSQMDDISEVVIAALEEEGNTYRHVGNKVSDTLSTAEIMKRYGSPRLSQSESDARFEDLTQDYLDDVLQVVTETNGEMLREIGQLSKSRSGRRQLKAASRKLLGR